VFVLWHKKGYNNHPSSSNTLLGGCRLGSTATSGPSPTKQHFIETNNFGIKIYRFHTSGSEISRQYFLKRNIIFLMFLADLLGITDSCLLVAVLNWLLLLLVPASFLSCKHSKSLAVAFYR